ncbi:MAG: hypothetical protein ACOX2O_04605 [Bdellovibrionota bacterium]|jgi:hypothetical protein
MRLSFFNKFKQIPFFKIFLLISVCSYGFLAWKTVAPFWFNLSYSTNDAYQQVYPFHKVLNPLLFKDDVITEYMQLYLPPLHYLICSVITWLSSNVILMSHIVTLLQISLLILFMFLGVRRAAGSSAALFATLWLLHTRSILDRATGGLARGWLAVIIACFLYLLVSKRHRSIIFLLFFGCLLNQVGTFVSAFSYGLFLCCKILSRKSRKEYLPHLIRLGIAAPFIILLTFITTQKPAEIGEMATLKEASTLSTFSKTGRFPLLPFKSITSEITDYALSPFNTKKVWYKPPEIVRKATLPFVILLFLGLYLMAAFKKQKSLIVEALSCFSASLMAYLLARHFAFRLFVPNRYLLVPMGLFSIFFVSAIGFNVFKNIKIKPLNLDGSVIFACFMACAILLFSGHGLYGHGRFDVTSTKRENLWKWLKLNTPHDALFAGHPSYINGLQLWAERTAYITTETAHPFYSEYRKESERRLANSFKAYYATTPLAFTEVLENEGIDYFIFNKKDFSDAAIKRATYRDPIREVVQELCKDKVAADFLYAKFSNAESPLSQSVAYEDQDSLVVDLKHLLKISQVTN